MKITVHQKPSGLTGGHSSVHVVDIDGDAPVSVLKEMLAEVSKVPLELQSLWTGSTSAAGHRQVEDSWTVRFAVTHDGAAGEGGPHHHDLQLFVAEEPPAGVSQDTRDAAFIDSGKGINTRGRESKHHGHGRMSQVCAGLPNPRNLCFFNCTMQALAALPPVHDYFRAVAEAAYRGMEVAYARARRAAAAQRGGSGSSRDEADASDTSDIPDKVPGLLSRVLRFIGGGRSGEEDDGDEDGAEGDAEAYDAGEGLVFEWDKQLTAAAELAARLLCLLQDLAFVYYSSPPPATVEPASALPPEARKLLFSAVPRVTQSAASVLGRFLDNIYDGSQQDSNELLLALLAFVDDAGLGQSLAELFPHGVGEEGDGSSSSSSGGSGMLPGRGALGSSSAQLAAASSLVRLQAGGGGGGAGSASMEDPTGSPRSGPSSFSESSSGGDDGAGAHSTAAEQKKKEGAVRPPPRPLSRHRATPASTTWAASVVASGAGGSRRTARVGGSRTHAVTTLAAVASGRSPHTPQSRFTTPAALAWARLLRDVRNPFAGSVASRTLCLACEARRRVATITGRSGSSSGAASSSRPPPPRAWRTEVVSCFSLDLAGPSIEACLGAYFRDTAVHDFDCGETGCHGGRVPGSNPALAAFGGGGAGRSAGPNAHIQTRLARPPAVLAIHLKRLTHPGVKLGGRVDFRSTLDLSPFLAEGAGGGTGGGAGHGGALYDLMAVVVHLGGGGGGHYVTFRRLPTPLHGAASGSGEVSRWVRASDRHVEPVAEGFEAVRAQEAYMLFYTARGTMGTAELEAAEAAAAAARELGQSCLLPSPPPQGMEVHHQHHHPARLHPRRAVLARRDASLPSDVTVAALEAAGLLPLTPLYAPPSASPSTPSLPAAEARRFLSICPPWIRAALWTGLLVTPAAATGAWVARGAAADAGASSAAAATAAAAALGWLGYGGSTGASAGSKGLLAAALWGRQGPIAAAAAGEVPGMGWVFCPMPPGGSSSGRSGLAGGASDDVEDGSAAAVEVLPERPCLTLAWY